MKKLPRPSVSQLPRPSELHLIDGRKNLEQMKAQKVRVYQWRALFGLLALVLCAVAGYYLFQDAVNIIVNGFCKEVFSELPMEFAMEAQALMDVSLEGSVG